MEQCSLILTGTFLIDKISEVEENAGVDRNSVKLVDESSVVVENTGLKLEALHKKAVVYQKCFLFSIDPVFSYIH